MEKPWVLPAALINQNEQDVPYPSEEPRKAEPDIFLIFNLNVTSIS